MGTLTKKLHILAGGTEETCDIYTTPEEVGGSPYLALEVDGTKGYVKLGSTTDANATHLRVEKDGVIYAAWKEAVTYVNVTITQSANQTIHVYTPRKNGGTDHTSSFKIPKGTAYEAEVIAADGYTAGTLNVSTGGVINGDMTFSASGAIEKEKAFIVTAKYHVKYDTDEDGIEGEFWSCGFGVAYADEDIKMGDITPQEIDGFKIIEVMDYGYTDKDGGFSGLSLEANRKCILHIKGKDYRLTHQSGPELYDNTSSDNEIGIEDKEQIKVTYTLL
jgi:hypothetical protein